MCEIFLLFFIFEGSDILINIPSQTVSRHLNLQELCRQNIYLGVKKVNELTTFLRQFHENPPDFVKIKDLGEVPPILVDK